MESERPRQQRRQGARQPLERRVDRWIETGLQVVDGVAGNRPGNRRSSSARPASANLERVGRWVGDKLDWFLDEEEAWLDEPSHTDFEASYTSGKRPLEAISRRVPKQISQSTKYSQGDLNNDEWPEESSFRVNRWQRDQSKENLDSLSNSSDYPQQIRPGRRTLPRSRRRRS